MEVLPPFATTLGARGKRWAPSSKRDDDDHGCELIWRQGQYTKTVQFNPLVNTPVFRTAAAMHSYWSFASFFKAVKPMPSYHHMIVVFNARWHPHNFSPPLPDEFIAKENLLVKMQDAIATDGVTSDATIGTSNLPPLPESCQQPQMGGMALLSCIQANSTQTWSSHFDPSPKSQSKE